MSKILALDVQYNDPNAKVSGVMFDDWQSTEMQIFHEHVTGVAEYEPGSFYKRELPCLLALIEQVKQHDIRYIIVDGYVRLGPNQTDGLGMYLYRALGERIPVIGVAKSLFEGTPGNQLVYRGKSIKPLIVTAVGMDENEARDCIRNMHGEFRLPTALKLVDQCCRQ